MKNLYFLAAIIVMAIRGTNARECSSFLISNNLNQETVENVQSSLFIPQPEYIGFAERDKKNFSDEQAERILSIMISTNTKLEVMQKLINDILDAYNTHSVEEVISILEIGIQFKISPVSLAKSLSNIKKNIPVIRNQLGFHNESESIDFSEAKFHETLILYQLISLKNGIDASSYKNEILQISKELDTRDAIEILGVLLTVENLRMQLSDLIEAIQQLREFIFLEKRVVGFSVNPGGNTEKVVADISSSVTILSIMKKTGIPLEVIAESFEKYKKADRSPSFEEYIEKLVRHIQSQQKQKPVVQEPESP